MRRNALKLVAVLARGRRDNMARHICLHNIFASARRRAPNLMAPPPLDDGQCFHGTYSLSLCSWIWAHGASARAAAFRRSASMVRISGALCCAYSAQK
jgi:hypothetical protein